jgi:hypothetical protein
MICGLWDSQGMAISMNSLRMGSTALAAIALLSLGGCGSIEVAFGWRTRLDKLPVTAVSATLSPHPGLSPGKSGRLIIVATGADNQNWTTVGPGHGKVLFDSFAFDSTVVQVNKRGVVSLPSDPRVSSGKTAHVHVVVVGHPDVATDLDVPLQYNVAFAGHFSGSSGSDGSDGMDGLPGNDGSAGSVDMTNPSAGGNGSDGSSGTNGGDGGDGSPGETVYLWITLQPGPTPLIQAKAASNTHTQYFLIDPYGGSLSIDAIGGSGGRGGRGGKGGRGGSGGTGFPSGLSGNNGLDGQGGRSGSDGSAGKVIVTVDPAAQQYLDRFHFHTGGLGFSSAASQVHTESVPPLW